MAHHAGVVGILLVHRQQGDLGELLQAGAGDGGAAVRHTDAVDARQGRHPVESQAGGLAGGDGVGTGPVGLEGHGHVGLMGRGIIGHLGVGVFGGAGVGHILDKSQGIIVDGDSLGLLPGLFQAGAVPGEGQGGGRGVAGSQDQLVPGTLNVAFQAVPVGPRGGNGAGHQAQLGLGGQGGVGAHHGVKGPAGVGSGVYGYGGQTQQVGVVGCGGVAAPADLAAAPVVGDAHLDAQGLGGAPDLFRVDAHAHVGQGETADERQGAGQAQGGPDEELENAALIQHQIAAALKDARDVHIHRGQEEELGVPVKLQAGAVQHGHGVGQHAVAQLRADALEAQGQRGPGRDDLEDGELRLQNELEGRNGLGEENGIVQVVDAAAGALEPDHAETVQVDAGDEAAHEEVEGIGVGDAVLALDGQLRLHGEGGEGGCAGHVHRPVAHGPDGEHALDAGHAFKVAGQAQGHGEVDALVFAAAEQDVVHLDGGRAAVAVARLGAVPHVGGGLKGRGVGVHCVGVVGVLFLQGTQVFRRVLAAADEVLLGLIQGGGDVVGLLGGGDEEGQIQAAAEADDAAHALHIAQLAVLELKEQAQQALSGLAHAGPQEGDVAVPVPVAAFIVGGEGAGLPVRNGGEAAAALPDGGAYAGDGEGGVEVHGDLVIGVGDGHLALPDVQAVVQGHHIVFLAQRDAGEHGGSVLFLLGEGAAELQQDGAVKPLACRFIALLRGVGVDGVVVRAIIFHRHHAVAVVAVLRVVGDLEAQGGRGDISRGGVGIVDGQLIFPDGQRVGDHHVGGIVFRVQDELVGGDGQAVLAVDLPAVGAGEAEGVGALVGQHAEIPARQVEMTGAGDVNEVGGGAGEAYLRHIPAGAGAEEPNRLSAQQVLGLERAVAPHFIGLEGEFAVGRVLPGYGVELKLQILGAVCLHVGQVDIVGVQIAGGFLKVAVLVVGGDVLPGVDHHPYVVQRLAGDVGHGGGDGKIAVSGVAGPVGVHLQSLGQVGEVEGEPVSLGCGGVGEHAVVAGRGGAAALSHAAQVIIQGKGAVGGQVVPVVGGGEIQAFVGRIVKNGGRQIVPVGKGHLFRRAGGVAHGAVEEVGEYAGILRVVIGEEAVLVAGNAPFAFHRQVAAAGLGHLVDAVILGTQGGVHEQAQPDVGGLAAVLGGVAQVGHAVLGGAGVGQAEGLGDGDAVH